MRTSCVRYGRNLRARLVAATFFAVACGGPALFAQAPAPPKTSPAAPKPPVKAPAAKPAASPDAPLPSARSIIDRHIVAIGGRKAIMSHTSSHATGTMTVAGSGITGVLDIYSAVPNKSLVKVSLGGLGDVFEGFDGVNGWSISEITGPRLTEGKELEQKKFDADFYSELHEEGRYASMKTIEKTTFDARQCYKVSMVKKDGSEDFDFYDVATGLRAGSMGSRESPMGPTAVTQVTTDYKKFAGILIPTTLKQTAMGVEQVWTFTSVEFDKVPPSTFEPPAQIKALLK